MLCDFYRFILWLL